MSIRTVVAFVLALVFGGAAAVGVTQVLNQEKPKPPPVPVTETVPCVVPVVAILPGTKITPDMLAIVQGPRGSVPAGLITRPEEAVHRISHSRLRSPILG